MTNNANKCIEHLYLIRFFVFHSNISQILIITLIRKWWLVRMDKEWPHCHSFEFKNEPAGMCCASEKVQLLAFEPLKGLLIDMDPNSNLLLMSICTYYSCFQMTSFGVTQIVNINVQNGQNFNSIFKIKSQVYHKVSLILLLPDELHSFLQFYFMGGEDTEKAFTNLVDARCGYYNWV